MIIPQPSTDRSSMSVSTLTGITLVSSQSTWRAKELWPRKLDLTGLPSAFVKPGAPVSNKLISVGILGITLENGSEALFPMRLRRGQESQWAG